MVRLVKDGNLDTLNTNHVKECLDQNCAYRQGVNSERLGEAMNRNVKTKIKDLGYYIYIYIYIYI
jgi:hypothetical protein